MKDYDIDSQTIVKNIRSLLDRRKGKTQKALAEYCGITTSAVTQWMTGRTNINRENLQHTADFFGVPISHLLESDHQDEMKANQPHLDPKEIIAIPEYTLTFSNTDKRIPKWVLVKNGESKCYERIFFTKRNLNPNNIVQTKISGNAMSPEIQNGDTILFSLNENSSSFTLPIKDGSTYALAINGEFKVKRLFRIKNGLIVASDNPVLSPETYVGAECEKITVFGKVIYLERSLN